MAYKQQEIVVKTHQTWFEMSFKKTATSTLQYIACKMLLLDFVTWPQIFDIRWAIQIKSSYSLVSN